MASTISFSVSSVLAGQITSSTRAFLVIERTGENISKLRELIRSFLKPIDRSPIPNQYFISTLISASISIERSDSDQIFPLFCRINEAVRSLEILSTPLDSVARKLPGRVCEREENCHFATALASKKEEFILYFTDSLDTLSLSQLSTFLNWGIKNWKIEVILPILNAFYIPEETLGSLIEKAFTIDKTTETHPFEAIGDSIMLYHFEKLPESSQKRVAEWVTSRSESREKIFDQHP